MIADFHNDYLTNENFRLIFSNYAWEDNVIVSAIFKGNRDLSCVENLCRDYFDILSKLDTHNALKFYLSFEDFSYKAPLEVLVEKFLRYKPSYVGMTWNYENDLAFGALAEGHVKPSGKKMISTLNELGIPVDLAHLCKQSFYDAIQLAETVVCSHTCFYDVNAHPRNIDFNQIKEIINKNGLIGLTFYAPFLNSKSNKVTIEDVFKHIDYFVQRFGCNNLAIGTDFYGCNDFPKGFSDYSFEPTFRQFLKDKGYSDDCIDKIFYKNLNTFLVDNKNRQSKM